MVPASHVLEGGTRDLIGDVLSATAFLASLLFVIGYHRYAKWNETKFGNHLMVFMWVATFVLGMAVYRSWFHIEHIGWWWPNSRIAAYILLNWVFWWRLGILLSEQDVFRVRIMGRPPWGDRKPDQERTTDRDQTI